MTAVVAPRAALHWHALGQRVRQLRGAGWQPFGVALLVGVILVALDLPINIDTFQKHGFHAGMLTMMVLVPVAAAQLVTLGWFLATPGPDAGRTRRLAVALLAAALATSCIALALDVVTGASAYAARIVAERGKPPLPVAVEFATATLRTITLGMLGIALLEILRRRGETQDAFRAVALQQSRLAQQVLEARLAAMQAQVEPRFLFDTLIGIEALYDRQPAAAAELLDRLIAYLRAALPTLREQGSTVGAELELVRAYLSVVNALHDGRPALSIALTEDCAKARFYPMLLIPLVQRAVRDTEGRIPDAIAIDVERRGRDLAIRMRIEGAERCADDPELKRVEARLSGLYGAAARLECTEFDGRKIELVLRVPAQAGRDR